MHGRGKPLSDSVDLEVVARKTPGFTGADLANVLNEAALLTARSNAQLIDNRALDEAIDRVIAGPQRRTRVMKDKEKLITAYHEGGHALAAAAMNHTDPVTKVTILPRGKALGYTMVLPLDDKYSVTRNELQDQLTYAMGGRVAEEIVFHDPTTGASNDIEKATSIARKMVTEYGMTNEVGPVKLGSSSGEVFMGRDMGHGRDFSERIAERVDAQVRGLIEQAHNEAYQVINAALDAQRRRRRPGRPHPHRRRRRGRQPLHGRHHPHAPRVRALHRGAAAGLRGGPRGRRRRLRRGASGRAVPPHPRGRHGGSSPPAWPSGVCCR